jgi:hypothetical protein
MEIHYMNYQNSSQLFMFTVSISGIIAITAILSNYAGKVTVSVGPRSIQLQIEGNAHRR